MAHDAAMLTSRQRSAAAYNAKLRKAKGQLDALWHKHFKGCQCCICRKQVAYCGHHVYSKGSSFALRYVLENGVPVCRGCHRAIHDGNLEATRTMMQLLGEERLDWLMERAHQEVHLTLEMAEAIADNLGGKLCE